MRILVLATAILAAGVLNTTASTNENEEMLEMKAMDHGFTYTEGMTSMDIEDLVQKKQAQEMLEMKAMEYGFTYTEGMTRGSRSKKARAGKS